MARKDGRPIFAQDETLCRVADAAAAPLQVHLARLLYTMGNPFLAGRDLTWTDVFEQRPVVMVSENLARELWGEPAAAVGKRIRENRKGAGARSSASSATSATTAWTRRRRRSCYWPC